MQILLELHSLQVAPAHVLEALHPLQCNTVQYVDMQRPQSIPLDRNRTLLQKYLLAREAVAGSAWRWAFIQDLLGVMNEMNRHQGSRSKQSTSGSTKNQRMGILLSFLFSW